MRKSWRAGGIYGIVFAVTLLCFFYEFSDIKGLFSGMTALAFSLLSATVVLVHGIKALRLYFALYGSELRLWEYLEVYGLVTPVSVILPWKAGELFRMYGYGQRIGNGLRGTVTVLFDRFVDTAALVTLLLLLRLLTGGRLTPLLFLFLVFLFGAVVCFFVFPGVYRFWHRYLLRADATEHRLWGLKLLHSLEMVYREIEDVVKGRGLILYVLSLGAWAVETGSLVLIRRIGEESAGEVVSAYLSAAMGGIKSLELSRFIFVSVAALLAMELVLQAGKRLGCGLSGVGKGAGE